MSLTSANFHHQKQVQMSTWKLTEHLHSGIKILLLIYGWIIAKLGF